MKLCVLFFLIIHQKLPRKKNENSEEDREGMEFPSISRTQLTVTKLRNINGKRGRFTMSSAIAKTTEQKTENRRTCKWKNLPNDIFSRYVSFPKIIQCENIVVLARNRWSMDQL